MSYKTVEEALEASGLNFIVEKKKLQFNFGGFKTVPDKMVTIRTDKKDSDECYLGTVGNNYEVIQNIEQFQVFNEFAKEGIISFENAGIFGNGEKTYVQVLLPNCIEINSDRGDIIEKYITIVNSHDGTISLQAFISPIRIVCRNTFNAAIRTTKEKNKIKHTKNAQDKLKAAVEMLNKSLEIYNEFDEFVIAANRTKEFSDSETKNFVKILMPEKENSKFLTRTENRQSELIETIYNGIGQNEIGKHNLYWLFNGVTNYYNNILPLKGNIEKNPFEYTLLKSGYNGNLAGYELCKKVLSNDLILA